MAALPTTYKAFVYEKFGPVEDVLRLRDVPMEPLPPTSVRVRVHSAAINPADFKLAEGALQMMSGTPSAEKPLRLGFDVAGLVVEVGSQATGNFKIGDAVYAMTPTSATGTLAEYVSLESDSLALKPETLDFTKAASAPAVALTSYQALISDYGKLQPGERLLILGGSTSVGMYAIQHAKMLGAHVIATASSQKVALLKSLGADEVIDYTTTKWSEKLAPHSLDVIFDCGVETESWDGDAQLILKKQGSRFVTVLPGAPPSAPKFGAAHVPVFCYHSGAQLATLAKLIDAGKLKPIMDSVFPFDKTLEALAKVQTGRVLGKVVVEIQ